MSSTTLLPIGTMIYFKGCAGNPNPDFGWITEHRDCDVYCAERDEEVIEPHYGIAWADGTRYHTTQVELEGHDFIILEETCK